MHLAPLNTCSKVPSMWFGETKLGASSALFICRAIKATAAELVTSEGPPCHGSCGSGNLWGGLTTPGGNMESQKALGRAGCSWVRGSMVAISERPIQTLIGKKQCSRTLPF